MDEVIVSRCESYVTYADGSLRAAHHLLQKTRHRSVGKALIESYALKWDCSVVPNYTTTSIVVVIISSIVKRT